MKTLMPIAVAAIALACGAAYYASYEVGEKSLSDQTSSELLAGLRTAKIRRGNINSTLSATGMVKPEELVEVGTQVTGMVASFGLDPVNKNKSIDHGSVVRQGDVLAQIDPTIYKAQVEYAEASLLRAKADMSQLLARREQTTHDWMRAKSLLPAKAISDSDYDAELVNHRIAEANVEVGQAAIRQCEATLRIAKTNLNYTVIKSPIDGVIIDRRINIGQTVVATLNAPPLFLIAKDLRRMQVWTSVNESEIRRIQPGQPVRFTVNAYPGEVFTGKVTQIRLNAAMTPNAVNYTVIASTNDFRGILPYLTANLQFEVEQHPNVLIVPNAALQWRPRPSASSELATNHSADSDNREEIRTTAMPFLNSLLVEQNPSETNICDRLWIKDGGLIRPVKVRVGASDGHVTEVAGDVREGMEVIIGESQHNKLAADRKKDDLFAQH